MEFVCGVPNITFFNPFTNETLAETKCVCNYSRYGDSISVEYAFNIPEFEKLCFLVEHSVVFMLCGWTGYNSTPEDVYCESNRIRVETYEVLKMEYPYIKSGDTEQIDTFCIDMTCRRITN